MNYYILFAEYSGRVSYGVDFNQFIVGIYTSREEAESALKTFENNAETFTAFDFDANENYGCVDEYYGLEECDEDDPNALKYKDFRYHISKFDGRPLYNGFAHYEE